MRLQSLVSGVMCGAVLVLGLATVAEAQATRTWVSGVGDDANPCSRTAPCKTFAGAISKTATNGFIHVLDPGGFGGVTITKAITIDGSGGPMAGVLVSGTNGIVVNAPAGSKVTLRNLDLEGITTGLQAINVINVGSLHLENLHITGWVNNALNFNPPLASNSLLFVHNVTIKNTFGMTITNARATIDNARFEGGNKGIFVGANALVTVRNSHASGNGEGFSTFAGSAIINLENCVATNNTFGITAAVGATIRVSNTAILSNSNTGMFNDGASSIISMGGNSIQGNPTPGTFTQTFAKQ